MQVWTKEGMAVAALSAALTVSPVLLVISESAGRAAIRDWPASGFHPIMIWAVFPMLFGLVQFWIGFDRWLQVRRMTLVTGLVMTIALAAIYPVLIVRVHANAVAAAPERAFELIVKSGGKYKRTNALFVRADGSIIGNEDEGMTIEYGTSCARVQRLAGAHGLTWVRVLERSRQPGPGQLAWGIRPEDCFGTVPLDQLPR